MWSFDPLPNVTITGKVTLIHPATGQRLGQLGRGRWMWYWMPGQAAGVPALTLPLGVTAAVDVICCPGPIMSRAGASAGAAPALCNSYAGLRGGGRKPTLRIVTVGCKDGNLRRDQDRSEAGEVVSTGFAGHPEQYQYPAVATP